MSAPRAPRAWASACSSSASEVEKRGFASSIAVVERPSTRGRRARRLRVLLQQVARLVLHELPRRGGRRRDVDAVGALLDLEDRHLLLVVALGPAARDDAVLPAVPRAHHELAAQPPLAERPALVVAGVADRAEAALVEEDGDACGARARAANGTRAASSSRVPRRCQVVMGASGVSGGIPGRRPGNGDAAEAIPGGRGARDELGEGLADPLLELLEVRAPARRRRSARRGASRRRRAPRGRGPCRRRSARSRRAHSTRCPQSQRVSRGPGTFVATTLARRAERMPRPEPGEERRRDVVEHREEGVDARPRPRRPSGAR